eukprot:COSAG01_NODE_12_length_41732_cov_160.472964_23_plen_75_part_00
MWTTPGTSHGLRDMVNTLQPAPRNAAAVALPIPASTWPHKHTYSNIYIDATSNAQRSRIGALLVTAVQAGRSLG